MAAKRLPALKRLTKKAKHGFRGYPVATVAFYGPTNRLASKVAVGVMVESSEEPVALERWIVEDADIRTDAEVACEVLELVEKWQVKSVVLTDGIIGCPHEEGVDYEGTICPMCPFWANRDRWTGRIDRGTT